MMMVFALIEAVARLQNALEDGERPEVITTEGDEEFGVTYGVDYEAGEEEYAVLQPLPAENGFGKGLLPAGVYAEIEDGTYGELQGLRVYFDDRHSRSCTCDAYTNPYCPIHGGGGGVKPVT